jgi:WD40 repeat protein
MKTLAIGWEDGRVVIWSESEKKLKEPNQVHEGAVRFLTWNDLGDRLVSGDQVSSPPFFWSKSEFPARMASSSLLSQREFTQ